MAWVTGGVALFIRLSRINTVPESLGNFELLVLLAILRVGDDAYGVPISLEIEQTTGRNVAAASVYAALERLQNRGLIASKLGEPTAERGGRAKRYYRVTAKGVREVRDAQRTLLKMWSGIPALRGELA